MESDSGSNSGSNSGRTVQFVYVDENGKLKTDPEAIAALQKLKGPIAVVSLFGKSLHGKGFIWNQLLSKSIGFEVQTLHRPCTGDIWMWIEPMKRISEDGTEYNLVLLDVEAAESNCILDTRNNQILALAILLSSVFIYGPALGVNDIAVNDLSRIIEISNKHDYVEEATKNAFSALGEFSPMFVQLMTEINSETMEGREDATPNNKLEKLQPKLLYGINALMKFVSERVRPKKRGDTIVTGPPLAGFTKSFSENVNNNVVPSVSSLWQSVEELEGRKACDTATQVYMSSLERSETPVEEPMLLEAHNKAVVKALTAFCESSIGNAEVKQKYERELWSFFAKAFEEHKRVANIEAYSRCCNAIEDMGKKLWASPCSHDDDMIKALDNAVAEYEVSISGPMKWQTLSSFLRKSIQDILVHRRGNQTDELLSENSKLKMQHREMENAMDLLKKQIEGIEKMKKEYQKRYENAIDDMGKLSDQFKHRIRDLESKCKSIQDEHSNLMGVLGSTRLEASEWKRKYEETLDENGVRSSSSRVGEVEASIIRCDKSIDWKIKYENIVNEQKAGLEKVAAMEESLKQSSAIEDGLRAEFARVLDEKEKVITEKEAKLVTLEQQLMKCSLEAKDLKLEISALNEKYESMNSAVELLETETKKLRQELEKLGLKLKNAENEALAGKKLVDSLRTEAEAARDKENKLETSLQEKCVEIEGAKNRIKELEQVCLKLDNAESETEAARKNENKLQTLLEEKCIEIDQAKSRIEELERVCLKLKDAETEAETARVNENKLETSLQEKCVEIEQAMNRIQELEQVCSKLDNAESEAEAYRKNENKLQTLLEEKGIEVDRAKSRIEELEKVCLKLKDAETEAATAKELISSMKLEMEIARSNENKLQTSLQERNIEIERVKSVIEDLERQKMELSETLEKKAKQNEEAVTEETERLERVCLKLKDAETEAATAKELVSSMKLEIEIARSNENRLQTSLQEKIIEIERAKGVIEDLERQKMELSETLEKRAKQNEEEVTELQRIVKVEKDKNKQEDSFKVSDEATTARVKRLRVETTTITACSGSDFAQVTEEEDTVSQESGKEATTAMTLRKCTSTTSAEAGGVASSSSTGMDYSQYTMKKLRSEIMKHGFGAELVVLKHPRKKELIELYERCVLRK